MNQLSLPQLVHQLSPPKTEFEREGQRFLGFKIDNQINALIPLVDLQATIKISLSEILPVPRMKDSLLGIINYRGKATWVMDLAHLMGAVHYSVRSPELTTGMGLLFEVENETVAFLIQQVSTIETYDTQQCLSIDSGMFTDRMRSFLSGYFIDRFQQPWVVMDLPRTVQSII